MRGQREPAEGEPQYESCPAEEFDFEITSVS